MKIVKIKIFKFKITDDIVLWSLTKITKLSTNKNEIMKKNKQLPYRLKNFFDNKIFQRNTKDIV